MISGGLGQIASAPTAYDKAEDLGRNMSPSEQNAIISFMTNVVERGRALLMKSLIS
jgi:hypothetical protein